MSEVYVHSRGLLGWQLLSTPSLFSCHPTVLWLLPSRLKMQLHLFLAPLKIMQLSSLGTCSVSSFPLFSVVLPGCVRVVSLVSLLLGLAECLKSVGWCLLLVLGSFQSLFLLPFLPPLVWGHWSHRTDMLTESTGFPTFPFPPLFALVIVWLFTVL